MIEKFSNQRICFSEQELNRRKGIKLKNYFNHKYELTSSRLIILVAFFLIIFTNAAFFSNVLEVYPFNLKNIGFLVSLVWVFGGVTVLLLSLACYKYTIKPAVITVLLLSSAAGYFMDSYNTIIDDSMIQNIVSTDANEVLDLLSIKLILYLIFLGVLPSFLVYKTKIVFRPGWKGVVSRIKLPVLALSSLLAVIFIFSDFYSSFLREHKSIWYHASPACYLYSAVKHIEDEFFESSSITVGLIGLDAKTRMSDKRRLVIFVVGETARADRFSLNGYAKETNPLLKKEDVISFTNFWSSGTSTASSVPCMFSIYTRSEFSKKKGQSTENVLDVLKHAGVHLLWLDNNSSSKGVADRIPYQNYRNPEINPVCDIECRDEGMLQNLPDYINEHPQGDIFIVLHQMGNHGPAYYKRYPPEFERFTPVCKTERLNECSIEEISNAYDNAILYTDYFLSKVIEFLKNNSKDFKTAMVYVSDHGESLGENGLYLHGYPYFIAPETQRHVPAILWGSDNFDEIDKIALLKKSGKKYTHDNIFHTVLGLMDIETSVYDREMDILENRQ